MTLINANNVLEHVPDLPQLMSNCLHLLARGGEFVSRCRTSAPPRHGKTRRTCGR